MDESVSEGRSQAVFLRWKKYGFGDLSERAESRSTPRFADLRGVDACGPLVDARDVTVGPRKNRRTFFKRSSNDGTTTLFFFFSPHLSKVEYHQKCLRTNGSSLKYV